MLGLTGNETKGEEGQWWESDGFVKLENRRGEMRKICKLTLSPLPFLKDLVSLCRGIASRQSFARGFFDAQRWNLLVQLFDGYFAFKRDDINCELGSSVEEVDASSCSSMPSGSDSCKP